MKVRIAHLIKCCRLMYPIIGCLLLIIVGQTARAITDLHPLQPPDTSSPQSTMNEFMDNINRAYLKSLNTSFKNEAVYVFLDRSAECLDLSEIAPNLLQDFGDETALLLKEVFDRIQLPPINKIPDKKTVALKGLTSWTIPQTAIKIVKIEKGPRKGEFLFSSGTVDRIREFYERIRHLPYKAGASVRAYEDYIYGPGPMIPQRLIRILPGWAKIGIYDQALWQWFGLFTTLIVGGVVALLFFRWTRPRKIGDDELAERATASGWPWHKLIFPVILILLTLMTQHFVNEQINITGTVLQITKIFLRTIFIVASGWAIIIIGNCIAEVFISSKRMFFSTIDPNLVRLILRLATIILLFVLLWNTTEYLGLSLTAVFASAGIIGLGVALAARETLANFFGGISIFLDRPFKSGDYIVLDSGERGKVVEVGLRSTRIMTRDDIQISIPNSLITNTKIINESAPQPRFRVRIKVGVAYGTNVDQAEDILLSIAQKNDLVSPVPEPRVRFRNFGESSLDLELLCWAHHPEDRGRLTHNLNHQIYKAFDGADIQIPFPQRDIHLQQDPDSSE